MDFTNLDFNAFAKKSLFQQDVNLIENPHIIKVMVIKKKHFEDLPSWSFNEKQITKEEPYPEFDILGRHKFQVIIRFRETGHLCTINDMDLAHFFTGQENPDKHNKFDVKQEILNKVMDLPQIILD
jgi:hypothetical protein